MGTAWIQLQEEETQEAVEMVSEMCEAVAASITKGRGAHRLSALGSKSLPNVVGAPVEGAVEIRYQISQ